MNNKTFHRLLFILFISMVSCKQSNYIKYYQNVNEARYYFHNEDYATAKIYFERGFKKVNKHYDKDKLFYAACLYEEGEQQKAIEILKTNLWAKTGLNPMFYFKEMNDTLKDSILKIQQKYLDEHIRPLYDTDLEKEIKLRLEKDGRIRHAYQDAYTEGKDSIYLARIADTMNVIDDDNMRFMDSLSAIHGFWGGINAMSPHHPLRIFLMHTSQEWFTKNERLLYRSLKKGHILPIDYAMTIDRKKYMENGKPSYYLRWGSKSEIDATPEQYYKRCRKIGLSPYFMDNTDLVPPYGKLPSTTRFYEYYHEKNSNRSSKGK